MSDIGTSMRRLLDLAAVRKKIHAENPSIIFPWRRPCVLTTLLITVAVSTLAWAILACRLSSISFLMSSVVMRTLPYPSDKVRRPSFGGPLNPDHSRRIPAGLVSYYALFQGMAASKPTSQLSRQKHILRYTQRPLRDLSCGSGFFPSRRWTLSLSDCLPGPVQ